MKELAPNTPSLVGQKQIGKWFVENVFAPGSSISWRDLVRQSTGQDLNSDVFVQAIKEKLSSNIS